LKEERGKAISINKSWCKSCGICKKFCPKNVLEFGEDGKPYVKDPEACISCGLCELRCPDFAITLEEKNHD
jgi:2-oxoglutarate ferredoxin oxidoreductase subunit delta